MRSALITGISGQDGAYLARLLADKGYRVWGTVRLQAGIAAPEEPVSAASLPNLVALGIAEQVELVAVDFGQNKSIERALERAAPDEVYNLAAQSSVGQSFEFPVETGEITGLFVTRLLQALKRVCPQARFFQASSSEMFGASTWPLITEETPFAPCNPYGAAKVYAHLMTRSFRDNLGTFACSGILFNHESPLRPPGFVSRKICAGAARIKLGLQSELRLGNLDARRDWGFAGDYVEAMHLMLQQNTPQDHIIATGQTHSVSEFVEAVFNSLGLEAARWVKSDAALYRPADLSLATGDPSRPRERLGWQPSLTFARLVAFLVQIELRRARGEEPESLYPSFAAE